ncbi:hypothetical protein SAMN04488132_103477 [Sediminibacterium ginsengisoli]|uniref:Uncharacterized protein n=1 Tax=Sediminibacterium ginsengisoli TaxID=413434 RepID=A0A1T4MNT0_9BACT|nr:hypothetical protein SAMN04488132_103477 [Sediminibacterium ginsengisoli]
MSLSYKLDSGGTASFHLSKKDRASYRRFLKQSAIEDIPDQAQISEFVYLLLVKRGILANRVKLFRKKNVYIISEKTDKQY